MLVLSGFGAKPVVQFNYNAMTYLAGNFPWISGNQPWTGQAVLLSAGATGWYEPIFDYGIANYNQSLFALISAGQNFQFSGSIYGSDQLSGIPSKAPAALTYFSNGSDVGVTVNGISTEMPFSASAITGESFNLGGSPQQSGIWLNGSLGEAVLYPSALDAADAQALAANERKYYGF